MNRSNKQIKMFDRWFKVRYVNRRTNEVDYSYVTGENKFFVKFDLQQSVGLEYIISVKEIAYADIIREITVDRPNYKSNVIEFTKTRNFSQDS